MSKTVLAELVNNILNSLGYKMLKIEFNNEEIAMICYTKDGKIFNNIKHRCYDENDKSYRWYGAKGIKVSKQWLDEPSSFELWALESGYKKGLTIDRIDENKGYCPENCRWVTNQENAKYKSTTNLIKANEELHTGREWSNILNFGVNVINKYVRKYGKENTEKFIEKYLENPGMKPSGRKSYYELYMDK